jgi:hypothetical protein
VASAQTEEEGSSTQRRRTRQVAQLWLQSDQRLGAARGLPHTQLVRAHSVGRHPTAKVTSWDRGRGRREVNATPWADAMQRGQLLSRMLGQQQKVLKPNPPFPPLPHAPGVAAVRRGLKLTLDQPAGQAELG